MRLIRSKLVNFGCHKNLEVNWHSGINGIVGANGAGKSTLLESVRFALTGGSDTYGSKNDNIRIDSNKNEPSFVELEFEHAGKFCYLKRSIRPSEQYLRINDEFTCRKDKDIAAALQNLLAVPSKFLSDHILVGQKNVGCFLTESPAAMSELFANLFGVERMSKIHEYLRDGESKLVTFPVQAEIDQLENTVKRLEEQMQEYESDLEQYSDMSDDFDITKTDAFKILLNHEQQTSSVRQYHELLTTKNAELKNYQEFEDEQIQVTAEIEKLASIWAGKENRLEQINREIEAVCSYDNQLLNIQNLETKIRIKRQEIEKLIVPVNPFKDGIKAPTQEEVDALRAEELRLHNFIEAFASGNSACPTCSTRVDNLDSVLSKYQEDHKKLSIQLTDAIRLLGNRNTYEKQLTQYEIRHESAQVDLVNMQAELVLLKQALPEKPVKTIDDLTAEQTELSDLKLNCAQAKKKYESVVNSLAASKMRLQQITEKIEKHVAEGAVDVDTKAGEEAAAQVKKYQERWKDRTLLSSNKSGVSQQIIETKKRLEFLRKQDEFNRKKTDMLVNFKMLRELFHREGLQKEVIRAGIGRLLSETNNVLEAFSVKFRVTSDDDIRFKAKFPGCEEYDVRRLSAGQQTLLALAARIAATSLFASNFGLLAIDEPTAALDAENQHCIETAVQALRQRSTTGTNLQVIVITHSASVVKACDHVIQL